MAISICPTYVDESLSNLISGPLGDRLQKMQKDNDLTAFEEVFSSACPRFINPATPDYETSEDPCTDAFKLQVKVFTNQIKQRANLSDIYSYLNLCTTVSTSKLASFLKVDEATLGTYLFNVKDKTNNLRWIGGPAIDGIWKSYAEVDFTVNKNMIQVAKTANPTRCGNFFIKQIVLLEDMIRDIRARK
jgi:translation initiation factor 3 subunit L